MRLNTLQIKTNYQYVHNAFKCVCNACKRLFNVFATRSQYNALTISSNHRTWALTGIMSYEKGSQDTSDPRSTCFQWASGLWGETIPRTKWRSVFIQLYTVSVFLALEDPLLSLSGIGLAFPLPPFVEILPLSSKAFTASFKAHLLFAP